MFAYKNRIINIKPITFNNVNKFYGLVEMFLSIASDKNLIICKHNKKKRIYVHIINQIINEVCIPVLKMHKLKDAVFVYNKIIELTKYEKIKEKILKAKSEYEASNITANGKTYNSNDYFKSEISKNYMSILSYVYIPEKDFLEIEFLKFEDILKTLSAKDLKDKIFLIDSLLTCNSFGDGKAYKELRSGLSKQLSGIENSFKDITKYLKDKREIKSCPRT
jgi:hypothetical protein